MPLAAASEAKAEPSLADEAFNANPIGGETFELMKFSSAPFRTMAQNAGQYGKPALEGRSASIRKGSHRRRGALAQQPAVPFKYAAACLRAGPVRKAQVGLAGDQH
jgi:hypothetical protein